MSRTRVFRVVATGARVAVGAVVAVACVTGVVTAIHAPWPEVAHEPAQVEVTPLPGAPMLVCNGDFRAIGRDSSDPLSMRSAGSPSVTVDGTGGAPASAPIAAPDLIGGGEVDRFIGEVVDRSAPLIAATESISVSATDLAGFAALPCGESRLESWLVGGSVATGTKDIVTLTNAAAVTSTVTLSTYGDSRSNRTVIVPAMTQVALPLSSIAAGNTTPVVEVTAEGAPVRAVLQSSFVRTLDPAGIDLQEAVAGPQRHPVILGVQSFDGDGDNADMTVLRLLSAGEDGRAVVTVRAVGSPEVVEEFTVDLTADTPAEASLSALAPGSYSVSIEADTPVVAGVRQQNGFGKGADFSWMTPAPEIGTDALFAVPNGPQPTLYLINEDGADATVTLENLGSGNSREVVVPAGSSVAATLNGDTVYRLSTSDAVRAAMSMSGAGALATWPLQPSAGAEKSITVYP
ncbi:MAG: hypothetical protein IJG47_11555 [Microbacterium sp.]|nr:hypothetical protein [Microbacterium sp.]